MTREKAYGFLQVEEQSQKKCLHQGNEAPPEKKGALTAALIPTLSTRKDKILFTSPTQSKDGGQPKTNRSSRFQKRVHEQKGRTRISSENR